jgi:hypothetical protein
MLLGWLAGTALAASAGGFYHPDDVAQASKQFASASERLSAPVDALQSQMDGYAAALRAYREGLDLMGARAPAPERDRLDALEVSYNRQHQAAQVFVDHLVTGFDEAFVSAKDRAVHGLGVPAVECERQIADGAQVPGMRPHLKANPACTGEDLNAKIAAAMDADPALTQALDDLLSAKFPQVALESDPQAVVGDGARWVSIEAVARAGARAALARIDAEDDTARSEIDALIEGGGTAADLTAKQADAEKITAETAAKRAALGAPLMAAGDKALAKWAKSDGATGWCAQPAALGGCAGTDATSEVVPKLLADPKVGKVLAE